MFLKTALKFTFPPAFSAAFFYTLVFLVCFKSNDKKRMKAFFLLLLLERAAEIYFFSSFWPSGHAPIYNCNIEEISFEGLNTTVEVTSQIKMSLLL